MSKRKTDPLLAALIDKLPPAGTEWPVEKQNAWLQAMVVSFGFLYGGQASFENKQPTAAAPAKPAPPTKPKKPMHAFVIDKQGYARNGKGERVLASEVTAEMFDERGQEGDFRTIIWADDSRGINGADLVIHA